MRDREYDDAGLTPKERFQERQSLATKELLIRSEEHTSELRSRIRISYAVFCLKKMPREFTYSELMAAANEAGLPTACLLYTSRCV